jgi:hypothetical protein
MGGEDVVVVLSPGYVGAVIACLHGYQHLSLAGYSDPGVAARALRNIPGSRILGFGFIDDGIPRDIVGPLRTFIAKADLMFSGVIDQNDESAKIPFNFVMSSKSTSPPGGVRFLQSVINDISAPNLSIGYYDYSLAYEAVTDQVVRQHLFGGILLSRRAFERHPSISRDTKNRTRMLSVKLPFPQEFIEVLDPLTYVEVDPFFQVQAGDVTLCKIRKYLYEPSESLLTEIEGDIVNIPESNRWLYYLVLRHICKGGLTHA